MIGRLKIGGIEPPRVAVNPEAHVYMSSMDLYDVEAHMWLQSRVVPGGGCDIAACFATGHIYVLASHTVELSFREQSGFGSSNGLYRRLVATEWEKFARFERRACVGVQFCWWRME